MYITAMVLYNCVAWHFKYCRKSILVHT